MTRSALPPLPKATSKVRFAEVAVAVDESSFFASSPVREAFLSADQRQQLSESIQLRGPTRAECEGELRSPELAGVDIDELLDLEAAVEAVEAQNSH